MFHGSKVKLDVIKTCEHPLSNKDSEKIAFATSDGYVAASFIPKWGDNDFEHGNISDGDKKMWYMKEMYPNAFKLLETDGYIHELDPKTFYRNEKLGLLEEYITNEELIPLKISYISNVKTYIEGYFTLFKYDEEVVL